MRRTSRGESERVTPVEERIDHEEAKRIAETWRREIPRGARLMFANRVTHDEANALALAYLDLLPATESAQPEEEPRA